MGAFSDMEIQNIESMDEAERDEHMKGREDVIALEFGSGRPSLVYCKRCAGGEKGKPIYVGDVVEKKLYCNDCGTRIYGACEPELQPTERR